MADTDRWRRIESIFHDALERAPEQRPAFLDTRCGGDASLRREVEELLDADAGQDVVAPPSSLTLARALDESGEDPDLGRSIGPWTLQRVLGTGGMGKVYLAAREGGDFTQRAAVKLIRPGLTTEEILARFRHERSALARLEHPGIARLLDGGATDDGLPWLAMEYVEGESLDRWCDGRRLGVTERLALFAEVCDTVAYAHGQLVVHRDLKPGNILVDADGKPRLLDFGVAKLLDSDAGPAITQPGGTPMTPAYASPEQVRGESVGTSSDVYTLGVLLYELLSGARPYRVADPTVANLQRAVVEQDPQRPSTALTRAGEIGSDGGPATPAEASAARSATPVQLRRHLSGDLDNIVLKALAKEPERRYGSAAELADDVRRHLAGLPVHARAPTVGYRLSKFVGRHRMATALGTILLAVLAVTFVQYLGALQRDQAQLADILRLSDGYRLGDLVAEMNGPLWPALREHAEVMDDWIVRAREVADRRPQHEARLASLAAAIEAGATDEDTLWWHAQLGGLVASLDAFAAEDPYGETLAAMLARRARVDAVEQESLVDAAGSWDAAIASIADVEACPRYEGLTITPQWGLVPLRRNPDSGLWEFRDVQTGSAPSLADGELTRGPDAALEFVLVPGGRFVMGAQTDATLANFDPMAEVDEKPVHVVELPPFFLSKFEMTQAQWLAATGANPSKYRPPGDTLHAVDVRHPAEQMNWDEAAEAMRRLGMSVPTEAQWEYACRAGTTTPWFPGADAAALGAWANVADLHARDHHGSDGWNYVPAEQAGLDDGHTIHAPVGSYAANAFGLHDMHGNVWEWCRDMPAPYYVPRDPADGARIIPEEIGDLGTRILRGGAYSNPPNRARSAVRWSAVRSFRTNVAGLRPARPLAD